MPSHSEIQKRVTSPVTDEERIALEKENEWLWYEIAGVRLKARLRKNGLAYDVCMPDGDVVKMWAEGFNDCAIRIEAPNGKN